jgi:hypothetical protein
MPRPECTPHVFRLCSPCICRCVSSGAELCRGATCQPLFNALNALQTIGMNLGYFTSFTLFLALNDPDFSNMYLRSPDAPSSVGVLSLASYFRFWAVVYAAVTAVVGVFKSERAEVPLNGALCDSLP